ncbi:MAG: Coenzyme F420 hydrogenase/dehydrogenase, beta subunit C-terminal domain [Clostridia bacterium]|nr:Coenzyme F420 hydrogenase/dehydrogenase, beta subunit C-terminal domain [Clostridia bacterium]
MKITLYQNEDQCCGCSACVNICPQNAISMIRNQKGFEYPAVDSTKCISCNACKNVCDFQNPKGSKNHILQAYAMQHKDKNVVFNSSSGGAFTAISDWVLLQGGTVYGAVFDNETFYVKHISAECSNERDSMRGSKYVQSSLGDVFKQIKKDLESGEKVLFSGTPCQCAGLCSYLHGHPENLVIVDLLCHGTPSPDLLVKHINRIEISSKKEIQDYRYRSKKYGYEHTHEALFTDGTKICNVDIKRILKFFVIGMRPSCFECKYTNRERYGDITIGDMWDAPKLVGITDHKGTSTVIVNTQLGKKIVDEIKDSCVLIPVDEKDIRQSALKERVKKPKNYEKFWNDYLKHGYDYVLEHYAPVTIKSWGLFTVQKCAHRLHLDVFLKK